MAGVHYPKTLPKKNQETSSNLNNRAISLLDFGQQKKAEELWQKALKIQPYHLESIYNYGLILWRAARLTDAELIERIEEARQFYPGKWLYRYLLASIHLERGEIDLIHVKICDNYY
ncbi:MAG: hypothetical protein BWK79_13560 [Beggiatoa sp. IS2]|nr:MAG: hypothetical protein BWK79_13560 [Beggiatoa sp. IS2]